MRSVEECYRGRNVRVFRLDRAGVLARLRERARRVLERRADIVEIRLFGSFARGEAAPAATPISSWSSAMAPVRSSIASPDSPASSRAWGSAAT